MGNTSFSAAAGVINESAKIVDQARQDLRRQIADLNDKMGQVRAHWQGQGQASFDGVQQAWTKNAQDVINVLDTFEQTLRANEATYQAKEQDAASAINKYSARLG
ncbi:MAG TPA: WXG100 family type VII secretion target [Phycicoccus sp.]|nr:WXG100 family type VII secretion target [Phycicoccus sp.]